MALASPNPFGPSSSKSATVNPFSFGNDISACKRKLSDELSEANAKIAKLEETVKKLDEIKAENTAKIEEQADAIETLKQEKADLDLKLASVNEKLAERELLPVAIKNEIKEERDKAKGESDRMRAFLQHFELQETENEQELSLEREKSLEWKNKCLANESTEFGNK